MNLIRGLLGWPSAAGHLLGGVARRAGPAIFGGESGVPWEPEDQNAALRNAMMTAGTGMATAAGGPRRWGEFGPSPIASIMAGLQAGREGYQGAQEEARGRGQRREITRGLLANPTREGLLGAWAQLAVNNPEVARQAATMFASGMIPGATDELDTQKTRAEIDALQALAEERRRLPVVQPRNLDPNDPAVMRRRFNQDRALIAYRNSLEQQGPGAVNREVARLNSAIDDARAAIATAESGLSRLAKNTDRPYTPSDSTEMRRIRVLRERLPALTARRDSLIGEPPPTARRTITADQRAYLQSIGQWNPARYEVR